MRPVNGQDIGKSAVELAPPVVMAAAAKVFGLTLPDWLALAALIYTVLQIAHLIWRWRRAIKLGRGE